MFPPHPPPGRFDSDPQPFSRRVPVQSAYPTSQLTSDDEASAKPVARGRAATMPSVASAPLRTSRSIEFMSFPPGGISPVQAPQPVLTPSFNGTSTLEASQSTVLFPTHPHDAEDGAIDIRVENPRTIFRNTQQTSSANSVPQVSQSSNNKSKKRKRPTNDHSEQSKPIKRQPWTPFAVRNPGAARRVKIFSSDPTKTTSRDVAHSAGPSCASSSAPPPPFQCPSGGLQPAYPPPTQGLVHLGVQLAHGRNRVIGHQPLSSRQNGMQAVTGSNIPILYPSFSAGAAAVTPPVRVTEGRRFLVKVSPAVKQLLRGQRCKLQTLTGLKLDEVLTRQEGASFSWIQLVDLETKRRWFLEIVEIVQDTTLGHGVPSSSRQLAQPTAPASYPNAVAGPSRLAAPARPSALSSLPGPSSVSQPMGFGAQSSRFPHSHQGPSSAPYARGMQIPSDAVYTSAGSMSVDQGMSFAAPATFGVEPSMGHPHHYLRHLSRRTRRPTQRRALAPWGAQMASQCQDSQMMPAVAPYMSDENNASTNFGPTAWTTHASGPHLPADDGLHMAESNCAPVSATSLHMHPASMIERFHSGSFPMRNELPFPTTDAALTASPANLFYGNMEAGTSASSMPDTSGNVPEDFWKGFLNLEES
ncbi:hypothetical protein MSAN_01041900 [Mycena sanguinolenta]|uniref:Uncharacterized protein n=1 Tax=Mycena sanguinolenta TaxID=230812 RepID=A0A8H6YRH4_9AGAR|nr:hypothetical protein MSAN_01041900 [Mycena sanguinolenta]